MNIHMIDGEREGSYQYHCGDGFYYHYNNGYSYGENEGNASLLYLRCINHHRRHCPGTAKIVQTPQGIEWFNLHRHNCGPDILHVRLGELRRHIVQEATSQRGAYETPTALVERIRNGVEINLAERLTSHAMKSASQQSKDCSVSTNPCNTIRFGPTLSWK